MRLRWIVLALGAAACGGAAAPAHVEISGMTPEAGAAVAAHAVCTREAQCGDVAIECSGGGTAGGSGSDAAVVTTSCSGQITPVVYDDCYNEASADITKLLSCPAITAADVDTLETCFDMLAAQPCFTQAEAEDEARAEQSGGSPARPAIPAACALLAKPPAGC